VVVADGGRLDLRAPGHALSSFARTVDAGFVPVAATVRLTADGVPVLLGADRLDSQTSGHGSVRTLRLAELRALWLKDGAGRVLDERVPTLDEALVWAKRRGAVLLLRPEGGADPAMLIGHARDTGTLGHMVLRATSAGQARAWRAAWPDARIAAPEGGTIRLGVATARSDAGALAASGHVLVLAADPRAAGAALRAAGRDPGPCLEAGREER
jgi:hypothetical protein